MRESVAIADRDGHINFESEHQRKDGTCFPVRIDLTVIRNDEGDSVSRVAFVQDLTTQKRAEQEIRQLNAELEKRVRDRTAQLEAANKELEAFAYSVSHDLRAPLRGIDGWSLALAEDYAGQLDSRAHQYVDRVRSETQRMGLLIDDLLQLSRVTRTEMQSLPVDLSTVARTIAARLNEANPDRQLEFVIEPGLRGVGDARLLEIALTNLFSNAVKFTGPHARARIEFGQADYNGRLCFYVRDDGVGFDVAYADRLFRAFQRLHKTSEFPGTGIGLAIVQRVIHRHGGRVWAESQIDRGAKFLFTLGETA
jgi:signal transduction histidine kinase